MNIGTPRNFGKITSSLKGWRVGGAGPPPVTGGIWEMVSLLPGAQPHNGVGQGPWSGWGLWPLLPWPPGASSSLEALGWGPGFEESSSNISGFSSISRIRGGIGPGISIFRVIALSAPTERCREDLEEQKRTEDQKRLDAGQPCASQMLPAQTCHIWVPTSDLTLSLLVWCSPGAPTLL